MKKKSVDYACHINDLSDNTWLPISTGADCFLHMIIAELMTTTAIIEYITFCLILYMD